MRTAATIAVSVAVVLLAGAVSASDSVSKADLYYQLYVDTLESARQAADKGYWDLYNDLYQKAQYYRREYEFYRNLPPEPPVVVYRTWPEPEVRYEFYTYSYPAPLAYYYTPAPFFGLRLRIGDYGHRPGSIRDRDWGRRGHDSGFDRRSGSHDRSSGFGRGRDGRRR